MNLRRYIFFAAACLMCMVASAQFSDAPAFPGAEGYGRFATGGRGGTVYHVTNLDDSGDGSLRAAVEASGKRIVVFDVSGTIYLESKMSLKNGDITILGQTAPGDGICVANCSFNVSASNVIIRYMRFRLGDIKEAEYAAANSDYEGADALSGSHKDGSECSNIIIDHCSTSWSTDECASFYGNKNFTMQWCIIAESLKASVHAKGSHGYGGIWGGENAAFHHNLIADHDSRNPRFDHGYVSSLAGPVDYVNNVVYNWGGNSTYGGETADCYDQKVFNMQNNYYKPGPATKYTTRLIDVTYSCTNCVNCNGGSHSVVPGKFYLDGNYMYGSESVSSDNWSGSTLSPSSNSSIKSTERFDATEDVFNSYNTISMHEAATAYSKVIAYAGCSFSRDAVDTRIVKDASEYGEVSGAKGYSYEGSNGSTNGMIDSQTDVGGFPTLSSSDAPVDTDQDGIPDAWETKNGLDPNDASDGAAYTLDAKEWYTNVEVYANSLVEEDVKACRADAQQTFTEYYPTYTTLDGDVENEGSAEETYDNEPEAASIPTGLSLVATGSVVWHMTSTSPTATFENIGSYFSGSDFSYGSYLTTKGTTTLNGITELTFGCTTKTSAGSDQNAVVFSATPAEGNYFLPSSVAFYASRIGTNGGDFDVTIANGDFSKVLATTSAATRNGSDYGYWTYATYDVTKYAAVSDDATTLTINVYNFDTTKAEGIGEVVINGSVYGQTQSTSVAKICADDIESVTYYNLQGQKVGPTYRGVLVKSMRLKTGDVINIKIANK